MGAPKFKMGHVTITIPLLRVICPSYAYPPRTKLAVLHFARRFIGVQGRESQIFVNFVPPEARNRTNRPARGPRPPACKHYR